MNYRYQMGFPRAPEDDQGGGETQEAAAETVTEAPETQAEAETEEVAEEPKPTRVPWYTKRIDQLTAQKSERDAELERLRSENQQHQERIGRLEALAGSDAPRRQSDPPAGYLPESEITKRAQQIAQFNTLQQKVEGTFNAGAAAYKDWGPRVQAAAQAFGPDLGNQVGFFDALSDLPNGADVYYALTGDLDRMHEVLAMNPTKMGMALASLSTDLKGKGKRVSAAPPPIEPIEGNSGPGADPDLGKLSMDDYAKVRAKQREERFAARRN